MNFSTKNTITYSVEEILNTIGQKQIFDYYLDVKNPFRPFLSPLRKDRSPSCCLRWYDDLLLFTDFGTGKKLNALGFVKELYQLSTEEAIRKICYDFNLSSSDIKVLPKKKSSSVVHSKNTQKDKLVLRTHRIPWTKEGLEYFQQYGITLKTLKRFNVHQIDYYFTPYGANKVSFGFEYFFSFDKRKILQPKDINNKWRTNLSLRDLEGETLIPTSGETLIITKSYKDVMTLWELGEYYAVAPPSENNLMNSLKYHYEALKARFTNIIILLDNDEAGRTFANIASTTYNLPTLFIKEAKDISDLVKLKGKSYAKHFIKSSFGEL
jgi:DNA primase